MNAKALFFVIVVSAAVASIVVLLITLPLFLGGTNDASLVIEGSTTVYPIIVKCTEIFRKEYPDALIKVNACGSGGGIAALLDGTADIAMSSRPLVLEEERLLAEMNLTLDRYVIGRDGIAIIVNPRNRLNQISINQLCAIYSGETVDWREMGNPSGMIVPISRDISSGTFVTFSKKVLGTKGLRADAQLIPSNRIMVESVAANENSIGYIGLGYVDESIKVLAVEGTQPDPCIVKSGKYPLSRDLFLFTRDNYSNIKTRLLDFVFGPEGQQIVASEGFIPITNPSSK